MTAEQTNLERQAFEYECPVFDFRLHGSGNYLDPETEQAFKCFKAGAAWKSRSINEISLLRPAVHVDVSELAPPVRPNKSQGLA